MDLEAELLKSISVDELELKVKEKVRSFHGFLTRDVALRLIAKERGLLKQEDREYELAAIPKGEKKISFKASVKRIWPVAEYSSGKRSRVVEVGDGSGTRPLVLWNDDVELAGSLRLNDRIAVSGAYEKGGELHLGYSGRLEVTEKAGFVPLSELKDNETAHVRGFIAEMEGPDEFVRSGRAERGFSFILSDGLDERRCVIFEGLDRAEKLRKGDEVIIEGARISYGNIELGSGSRIRSRRASEMLLGTIRKLDCEGERLVVGTEDREVAFDRENGLRFLGVSVADDITLATVVSLKKDSVLNTRIAVRLDVKDGRIAVRC